MSNSKRLTLGLLPLLGLAFLLIGSAANARARVTQATITIIPAQDDAYVYSDDPNTNFGTGALRVGSDNNGDYESLLHFDLSSIPANSTVISATLRMYNIVNLNVEAAGAPDFTSAALDGPWTEFGVTYNNRPTFTYLGDPPLSFNFGPGWHSFEVTNIVSAWVSGSKTNNGLIVYSDGSIGVANFFPSEQAADFPELHVSYLAPTNTPTNTLVPSDTPTGTLPPTATASSTPVPSNTSCSVRCTNRHTPCPSDRCDNMHAVLEPASVA